MVRTLAKNQIKKVIVALREGPKTYSELKGLGVPEKSLSRILNEYLEYWELAKKTEDGRWTWYFGTRRFESKEELDILKEHSENLMDSMRALLAEGDLWLDFDNIPHDLKNVKKIDEARKWIKYVEEHLQTGYPDIHKSVARFRDLNCRIKSASRGNNKRLIEERVGVYRELVNSIAYLIDKIEHGEPLGGYCGLCPRVSIKPRKD